jgi:hypothetical protein
MDKHVEHYLNLREQGKNHEAAMLHTMQMFGILRPALRQTLRDAYVAAWQRQHALEDASEEHFWASH